jgi:hypothetical protein
MEKIIDLVGGLSWESTAEYYRLLNQLVSKSENPWNQPRVLIDSLNFGSIVPPSQARNWDEVERLLLESANRLIAGGADFVLWGRMLPKGGREEDCKSPGSAFEGSNPSPATSKFTILPR